jgi:hypothetical protein
MRKVYAVIGEHYCYEDSEYRIIKIFSDKKKADELSNQCNLEVKRIYDIYIKLNGNYSGIFAFDKEYINTYDPLYKKGDWEYSVIEVEFIE